MLLLRVMKKGRKKATICWKPLDFLPKISLIALLHLKIRFPFKLMFKTACFTTAYYRIVDITI